MSCHRAGLYILQVPQENRLCFILSDLSGRCRELTTQSVFENMPRKEELLS